MGKKMEWIRLQVQGHNWWQKNKCNRGDCPYLLLGTNSNELWKITFKLTIMDESKWW